MLSPQRESEDQIGVGVCREQGKPGVVCEAPRSIGWQPGSLGVRIGVGQGRRSRDAFRGSGGARKAGPGGTRVLRR